MFIPFGFMAGAVDGGDADANAYISAVTTAGGTLTSEEEDAINELYTNLKGDSLYSKIKVMYPLMGATSQSTAIDGINPNQASTTITWNVDLTGSANHTTAGITIPAGDIGYGDIDEAPSDLLSSVNDASWGFYYSDAENSSGAFVIGQQADSVDSTTRFQAYVDTNGTNTGQVFAGFGNEVFANFTTTPAVPTNRWIGTRTSSTNLILYQDGVEVSSQASSNAGASLNTNDFQFFSADASAGNQAEGTFGFLFIGEGLDSTEANNMDSHLSTFLAAIGR